MSDILNFVFCFSSVLTLCLHMHESVSSLKDTARLRHSQITSEIPIRNLRNRKRFPCFHKVMVTRVEVWENEKSYGNTSPRRVFPQLFQVLPNFCEYYHNFMGTRKESFLFVLQNIGSIN